MKRLILVRHGKSSWELPVEDKNRPLQPRAYEDAEHVIAAFTAYLDFTIHMFSSPAKRALTTAELFKSKLGIQDEDFEMIPQLYTFDADEVLSFIKSIDDKHHDVMLFGHNPAFTELVNRLGSMPIENLPTTGLVCITFDVKSWSQLLQGDTQLYLFPKHLR